MPFELLATDSSSHARRGRLTTPHGVVETPVFMPVGTQGTVTAVHPQELKFIVGTGVARAETPAYYDRIEAAWAGHKIYEDQWVRIYKTGTLPP